MMERTEILELLREVLSIEIEMSDSYECESRYVSCSVTLRLDGEVIATDYSSAYIS
jgi:hypothetical protein